MREAHSEAADLARRVFPHVVVMDVRMPVLDGIEATRLICADPTLADTHVLVLTTFDLDEYVYAALRAGASGFVLKDVGPSELLHAIRIVAAGLSNADIAGRLMISPLTVKTHVGRVLAKLDCHDRAQLVNLDYETGLATPGERDKATARDHPSLRFRP